MNKWLRRIRAIPDVVVSYSILRMDVQEALIDPQVRAALDRFRTDPVISALFPRVSSEWRTLENALNQLR